MKLKKFKMLNYGNYSPILNPVTPTTTRRRRVVLCFRFMFRQFGLTNGRPCLNFYLTLWQGWWVRTAEHFLFLAYSRVAASFPRYGKHRRITEIKYKTENTEIAESCVFATPKKLSKKYYCFLEYLKSKICHRLVKLLLKFNKNFIVYLLMCYKVGVPCWSLHFQTLHSSRNIA